MAKQCGHGGRLDQECLVCTKLYEIEDKHNAEIKQLNEQIRGLNHLLSLTLK